MSGKFALIIGNTEYTDPGLAQLTAPGKDAEDFARILKSPDIGSFDKVFTLINREVFTVNQAIEDFFDRKKPDDLLILYFSGHGVRDENGSLYLAVKNTTRSRLRSTAIKSDFIREAMDQSRSKRQVLILDCCNSGAFAQGTKSATGTTMGTATAFEGTGYGRVILTASDSTQFAWEGDKVIGNTNNSLFTHFLIEGLEGKADQDGDGKITVDELYDYAYEQILNATPKQTPGKWSYKQHGEIVLRRSTRVENIKPEVLPPELTIAIDSSLTLVREGAVKQLEVLLNGKNMALTRSAREALEKIASEDDSNRVAMAAREALRLADTATQVVKEKERLSKQIISKPKPLKKNATWAKPIIIGFSVLFLSICAIASRTIWTPFFQSLLPVPPITQTDTPSAIQTEISAPNPLASTPLPAPIVEPTQTTTDSMGMRIVPADTEAPMPTIDSTLDTACANAAQRLRVGINAEVVTGTQNLNLRDNYSDVNSNIIIRMPPHTVVKVVEGPVCASYRDDYFWWWKVDVITPQPAVPQTGWVVEGKDESDEIFILPKAGTQISNEKDGATLIYIPPGKFIMGLTNEQAESLKSLCRGNRKCEDLIVQNIGTHEAELTNGYWIYRTEVSNAQYAKCVNCTGSIVNSSRETFPNHPVVGVNWDQAKTYCEWAGAEGRLPKSDEWEYAARGSNGQLFPWGDEIPDGSQANVWIPDNSQTDVDENPTAYTNEVNAYPDSASPFGLLNMTGNVWEWVDDDYDPDPSQKVGRGGSSWIRSALSSVAIVDSWEGINAGVGVGFRCVSDKP